MIITTHSPVAVTEFSEFEVAAVHSTDGVMSVRKMATRTARRDVQACSSYEQLRLPRLLDGFAGNGRRFRHRSGLLCGFRRQLFAAGFADLGKRWRIVAFRAGSACETAQKLQTGVRVR